MNLNVIRVSQAVMCLKGFFSTLQTFCSSGADGKHVGCGVRKQTTLIETA